ncbi:MAG: NADH-quinone oxidoreductase subunit L [Bacteroidetes bacterium]|nr:NADH-quinone oxidoreductase subunit L [Bacteroidota bacterium]
MHEFWLIPIFPLIGFLVTGFGFRLIPRQYSGLIASLAVLVSFVFSIIAFVSLKNGNQPISITLFDWIQAGNLSLGFSFHIDQLTSLMLLVVTGVGFLIHVYSIGYMHEDAGVNRFFSYMNLFMFSMLLLVMAGNFVVMFIGWEGVGLCSYLLIGFWFKDHANNNAAKKAFIMNRIGDLGFLLGMFLIFRTFGSLEFTTVFEKAKSFSSGDPTLLAITILLFIGATGKSAQIPLFTWLPDAMAGPTPVSALIHAATMVTAGVYMVARCNILFILSPVTMQIIAWTGLVTALMAAMIAMMQNDIKKVLAYSTISQLGYMFLALGVGSFTGAMFHLTTHAFFKALLFLGAGSVIHALGGEQDIRKMGGLSGKLRTTFITFLIATLAIAGIPPLSGFFSKDEILMEVYKSNPVMWAFALAGALLTTFYMFRLLFLVFPGKFRGTQKQEEHMHESPAVMTVPLLILAVLAAIGGFMGIPALFGGSHNLGSFLKPVLGSVQTNGTELSTGIEWMLIIITLLFTASSILLAWWIYSKKKVIPIADGVELPALKSLLSRKFYVDEIYDFLFVKPFSWLSDVFHRFIEVKGIDAVVNGIGNLVIRTGNTLRLIQTGNTGFYMFVMVIGIILILLLNLLI